MIQYARAKFELDRKLPDGSTIRDTAQSVFRQTKVWPEDVPLEPDFPEAMRYIWDWFISLGRGRGSNGFGPSPMSWPDIRAWCYLMDVAVEPWEADALRQLDGCFLLSLAKNEKDSHA